MKYILKGFKELRRTKVAHTCPPLLKLPMLVLSQTAPIYVDYWYTLASH